MRVTATRLSDVSLDPAAARKRRSSGVEIGRYDHWDIACDVVALPSWMDPPLSSADVAMPDSFSETTTGRRAA